MRNRRLLSCHDRQRLPAFCVVPVSPCGKRTEACFAAFTCRRPARVPSRLALQSAGWPSGRSGVQSSPAYSSRSPAVARFCVAPVRAGPLMSHCSHADAALEFHLGLPCERPVTPSSKMGEQWINYWINECPLSHECSANAWHRARVQSWTSADECKGLLMQHFKSNPHHANAGHTDDDLQLLVDTVVVEQEVCEFKPKPKKRPSYPGWGHNDSKASRTKGGNGGNSRGGHGGGNSSHDGAIVQASPAADDCIVIRRSLLKRCLDSVERASMAAQHAVKISAQARDAFEEEKRRLDEAVRELSRFADSPVA